MTYRSEGEEEPTTLRKYALGAVSQTPVFNYQSRATQLSRSSFAATPLAVRVVVTLGKDGIVPVVMPFADQEMASDFYESTIADPGSRAYVAIFDRQGIVGEDFFGVVHSSTTTFSFDTLKRYAPYLVGAAILIGGAVYFGKGARTRRRARRRR